jgi:hypothetical protein
LFWAFQKPPEFRGSRATQDRLRRTPASLKQNLKAALGRLAALTIGARIVVADT